MKAVAEMKGSIVVAENINGRELDTVAHRLRILVNDVLGGSGGSLLHGRIDLDRIQRNALVVGAVALIASVIPATRASRIDPVVALRDAALGELPRPAGGSPGPFT